MNSVFWYYIGIGLILSFAGLLVGVRAAKLKHWRFVVGSAALVTGLCILAVTAYKIASGASI